MSIKRIAVLAFLVAAPLAFTAQANADQPIPDPTGTCTYNVDPTSLTGAYSCSSTQSTPLGTGGASSNGTGTANPLTCSGTATGGGTLACTPLAAPTQTVTCP